ncbi:hypothetical protein SAMN05421812_10697 [Asanoa hainanensis]|uniref:Uncharacterized protein n=1 Tax=Asanoa hainanensis TaxID=560556 RepID=A0A239MP88_9ACTN|nr:hypothetical protein [Asanoa hainanensis]SNT44300.1 hypothetical protein SAMN05421812_10697 [Asanoa hainanensis]
MALRTSRSAELARIAAETAAADTSSVRLRLIHGPAGAGFAGLLKPFPDFDPPLHELAAWPSDFWTFSVAGLAMSVCTWPAAATVFSSPFEVGAPRQTDYPDTFAYDAFSVPNPGFLNEPNRRIDALLTLNSTHWSPSYRDCLVTGVVLARMCALAVSRGQSPIVHLHTPVSPFIDQQISARGDGSLERLRDAVGPCVRVSVAVNPQEPTARLAFEQGLVALAEEFGLGLKLNDRRFNRVPGEWFTIRGFDRERYRQVRARLFPETPMHLPKHAMIASVMGPARLGMAADVISRLSANGVGVLAAAVSSVRKIGFVNLVLPLAEGADLAAPAWSGEWDDGLKLLAERCRTFDAAALDRGELAAYKVALSPPMPCSYPRSSRRTGASVTGRVPYPLWLRWDVPNRTVGSPLLLSMVEQNLAAYASQTEVAYAQARVGRGDTVRGRAKLVVLLAEPPRDVADAQALLNEVAERVQERTLEQLLDGRLVGPGQVRLRLSPRERWLTYAGVSA